MINALIVGCGNVGALYDFDTHHIKSHAKILHQLKDIAVTVYDPDSSLAAKVAQKYNFSSAENEEVIDLTSFQWVVIASPTFTHFSWLKRCFQAKVPLVICEKPVSKDSKELIETERLYNNGSTKIVVNYFRRYQPVFIELKNIIDNYNALPENILIKYQRGFLNNFSHAADLLAFLFNNLDYRSVNIVNKAYDEFDDDPTISFTAQLGSTTLNVVGLTHVKYSCFEMEFFFTDKKIALLNNGNQVIHYSAEPYEKFYKPLKEATKTDNDNLLDNYMVHVYQHVQDVYNNKTVDGFIPILNMNKALLNILN
jgi:predicted dehydrogenase